jgi:N-acyl homoserine lactone hydrolase
MVEVRAVKTGTIRIRPRHRGGNMDHPVWRRRLAILLDPDWTQPLPIYTFLIVHDEGLILLDSGESALSGTGGWFPWWTPVLRRVVDIHVEPGDEIGPRLRSMGVNPGKDLRMLVLSHLHHDHADV